MDKIDRIGLFVLGTAFMALLILMLTDGKDYVTKKPLKPYKMVRVLTEDGTVEDYYHYKID